MFFIMESKNKSVIYIDGSNFYFSIKKHLIAELILKNFVIN
jgi:hypothetical protein